MGANTTEQTAEGKAGMMSVGNRGTVWHIACDRCGEPVYKPHARHTATSTFCVSCFRSVDRISELEQERDALAERVRVLEAFAAAYHAYRTRPLSPEMANWVEREYEAIVPLLDEMYIDPNEIAPGTYAVKRQGTDDE